MMGGSGGLTLNRLLGLLAVVAVSLPYTVYASPAWNTGTYIVIVQWPHFVMSLFSAMGPLYIPNNEISLYDSFSSTFHFYLTCSQRSIP